MADAPAGGRAPEGAAPDTGEGGGARSLLRASDFWMLSGIVVAIELLGRSELARLGVDDPHSIPAIRGTGVIRLAQMVAVFVPLAVIRGIGPGGLGLRVGDWRRGLAWGAGVSAVLLAGFGLAALGCRLWNGSNLVRTAFGESPLALATTVRSRAVVLAAMAVVGPLAEEVFFRGIVYQGFRRRLSAVECILASSLLFAAAHFHPAPYLQLIGGIAFGLLYEKTGSLLAPFLVHAGGNLAIVLLPLWLG